LHTFNLQIGEDREVQRQASDGGKIILCDFYMIYRQHHIDGGGDTILEETILHENKKIAEKFIFLI